VVIEKFIQTYLSERGCAKTQHITLLIYFEYCFT